MKVYVNAGHDRQLDSGAVNPRLDLRECDAAYELACLVMSYLKDNGIAVCFGQNDDLYAVCDEATAKTATSLFPFISMLSMAGPAGRKR